MSLEEIRSRNAGDGAESRTSTAEGIGEPPRKKFTDPQLTAKGERRAVVPFEGYTTVWFNTGTLCNIACQNCYIESSPRNDRLAYLTREEVRCFLDETIALDPRPLEIGFTGGEPFMNPDFTGMLDDSLAGGFRILILTNAMRPMQRNKDALLELHRRHPGKIHMRVSIDHYEASGHEKIRGSRTWQPTLEGLAWLAAHGFDVAVAGRFACGECEDVMRKGYSRLFQSFGLRIDAFDPSRLVLFPEMSVHDDVPEISERCWGILDKSPGDVMCASSRMVVKRKGSDVPVVVSCTLLPYAEAFEMGISLDGARGDVSLNHPHCARFCVIGSATCSGRR